MYMVPCHRFLLPTGQQNVFQDCLWITKFDKIMQFFSSKLSCHKVMDKTLSFFRSLEDKKEEV